MTNEAIVKLILSLIGLIVQALTQTSVAKSDEKVFHDLQNDMAYYQSKLRGAK